LREQTVAGRSDAEYGWAAELDGKVRLVGEDVNMLLEEILRIKDSAQKNRGECR